MTRRRSPSANRARASRRRARAIVTTMVQEGHACWLCQLPINLDLPFWHPAALTADHVVRFRDGGKETRDNLRPAHLLCNRARG